MKNEIWLICKNPSCMHSILLEESKASVALCMKCKEDTEDYTKYSKFRKANLEESSGLSSKAIR